MEKFSHTDVPGYIKSSKGVIFPEKTESLSAYKKQKDFYKKIKEQDNRISNLESKLDKIIGLLENAITDKSK